jgi:dTDP-4-dehydrorhamnose 3,5-epimerase
MSFLPTGFSGLWVFSPNVFQDSRGYFFESYNESVFAGQGISCKFVQDNQSRSTYGVIRGLHYQLPPRAQTKLVRVVEGSIWDVAVDLRKGSPTYGKYFGVELSADNKKQLYVPIGFAHGFSVLSSEAVVLYKCDDFYHQPAEAGIRYDDPELAIEWKIPADQQVVSEKDLRQPWFRECPKAFEYSV